MRKQPTFISHDDGTVYGRLEDENGLVVADRVRHPGCWGDTTDVGVEYAVNEYVRVFEANDVYSGEIVQRTYYLTDAPTPLHCTCGNQEPSIGGFCPQCSQETDRPSS